MILCFRGGEAEEVQEHFGDHQQVTELALPSSPLQTEEYF